MAELDKANGSSAVQDLDNLRDPESGLVCMGLLGIDSVGKNGRREHENGRSQLVFRSNVWGRILVNSNYPRVFRAFAFHSKAVVIIITPFVH